MNLIYALVGKDGKPNAGAACPRPLSRKKLRSIMRDNRANLTGRALASSQGRFPGPGKFRRSAAAHMRELEKQQERNPSRTIVALGLLRQLFAKKPSVKRSSAGRKV